MTSGDPSLLLRFVRLNEWSRVVEASREALGFGYLEDVYHALEVWSRSRITSKQEGRQLANLAVQFQEAFGAVETVKESLSPILPYLTGIEAWWPEGWKEYCHYVYRGGALAALLVNKGGVWAVGYSDLKEALTRGYLAKVPPSTSKEILLGGRAPKAGLLVPREEYVPGPNCPRLYSVPGCVCEPGAIPVRFQVKRRGRVECRRCGVAEDRIFGPR